MAVGSYRGHEIEVGRDKPTWRQLPMGLNPNAPVWTPGQGSSGEHGEGGGMIAHRVGKHPTGGRKGSRAGEPRRSGTGRHLAGKGKHRVNSYINPRIRRAIKIKKIKKEGRRGGGAGRCVG